VTDGRARSEVRPPNPITIGETFVVVPVSMGDPLDHALALALTLSNPGVRSGENRSLPLSCRPCHPPMLPFPVAASWEA
jgi:hypothetical protein